MVPLLLSSPAIGADSIPVNADSLQKAVQRLEQSNFGSVGRCTLVYMENENNHGAAESRNIGIRKAKGKYLAFTEKNTTTIGHWYLWTSA